MKNARSIIGPEVSEVAVGPGTISGQNVGSSSVGYGGPEVSLTTGDTIPPGARFSIHLLPGERLFMVSEATTMIRWTQGGGSIGTRLELTLAERINTNQMIFEGDSYFAGFLAPPEANVSSVVRRALSDAWTVRNLATSGYILGDSFPPFGIKGIFDRNDFLDSIARDAARSVLVVFAGVNNYPFGGSAATNYANMIEYVTERSAAGYEVIVGTPIDHPTPASAVQSAAFRDLLIGAAAGGTGNGIVLDAGAYAVADFGADVALAPNTGVHVDPTYYNPIDQAHLTTAGLVLLANTILALADFS